MRTQPIVDATEMTAAFAAAALAGTYKDPQQRFEINIPTGWTAEHFGEGVKVARGAAHCLVMEGQAPNPEALVSHLAGQVGSQWTRFQQLKQGSATLGGQPATYRFHSGVNVMGVPSNLKVLAVSSQGTLFGVIESSPEKQFPAAKAGFEQIEQGFQFKPGQVPTRQQQAQGTVVGGVARVGPAEKAGIRAGDLAGSGPGDTIEFVVVRVGRQSVVRVRVGVFHGQ